MYKYYMAIMHGYNPCALYKRVYTVLAAVTINLVVNTLKVVQDRSYCGDAIFF